MGPPERDRDQLPSENSGYVGPNTDEGRVPDRNTVVFGAGRRFVAPGRHPLHVAHRAITKRCTVEPPRAMV
jgi:hypothetical protein